jgi:hypothetical protein
MYISHLNSFHKHHKKSVGGNARGLGHSRNNGPLRPEAKGQLFLQCLGPRLLNNIKCKVFFILRNNNHGTWWVLDGCPLGVMVKKFKKENTECKQFEKRNTHWYGHFGYSKCLLALDYALYHIMHPPFGESHVAFHW